MEHETYFCEKYLDLSKKRNRRKFHVDGATILDRIIDFFIRRLKWHK